MTEIPTSNGQYHGRMAYYLTVSEEKSLGLPLRTSPIRFAVMRKNGLSSNAWRVWVENSGDAYVVCRDHMKEMKASLHQSGKRHIAFTTESGLEMPQGSRFWNQWHEPRYYDDDKVVPTLNLLFPSWGSGLTQEVRKADASVWDRNQVFVEAAEAPRATIISFVITNEDLDMTFSTAGESPSFPLGILSAGQGKKLWVIVQYAPEGNMRELASKALSNITADTLQKLSEFPSGHTLGLCVTGPTHDGGAYWMPFPAQLHRKEDESP